MVTRLAVAVLLLSSTPSFAREVVLCRNGAFADHKTITRGVVNATAGKRVHFQEDTKDGCPNAKKPACASKAYLVPSNEVFASVTRNGFRCVWFQPKKAGAAGTVGWIPEGAVTLDAEYAPPLSAWVGTFASGDDSITIATAKTALKVKGEAYWPKKGGTEQYPEHSGEFSGLATPKGNVLHVKQDGCKVTLRLLGRMVFAKDNGGCGGANVRFMTGYTRTDGEKKK